MIQEFPKALYGPEGVCVVVDDAEQEAAQMAEWDMHETAKLLMPSPEEMQDAVDRIVSENLGVIDAPSPRRGRPPKAR